MKTTYKETLMILQFLRIPHETRYAEEHSDISVNLPNGERFFLRMEQSDNDVDPDLYDLGPVRELVVRTVPLEQKSKRKEWVLRVEDAPRVVVARRVALAAVDLANSTGSDATLVWEDGKRVAVGKIEEV